jgi:hypothetical protein
VAGLLGVRPWLGDRALEGPLKARRSPRILHLATHGFFLADPPRDPAEDSVPLRPGGGPGRLARSGGESPWLRSGLALAGVNAWLRGESPPPEAEDGLLTAEDVSGLDLLDTDLVVLSACETGSGEQRTGESVFGLRRAFVLAGARTLVLSLWKAPDEPARELLQDFYRRLLAGQGRSDALRAAQLALRGRHPDPHAWGAFVCQGDDRPLRAPERPFGEAPPVYVVGRPAEDRSFVGRADVLKTIKDNLGPGAGRNILVLRGQRRTGKTSVLYRLRDTLAADTGGAYLPVFVDLQGLTLITGEAEFLHRLAWEIWQQVQAHGVTVPEPRPDDFDTAPVRAFELSFLKALRDVLGGRRVVLMLDEFAELRGDD